MRSITHKVHARKTNKACLTPEYSTFKVIDNKKWQAFGYKPEVVKAKDWYNERYTKHYKLNVLWPWKFWF